MAKKDLQSRENWQAPGSAKAHTAERHAFVTLTNHFEGTPFEIKKGPRDFIDIYGGVLLDDRTLKNIYTPAPGKIKTHGFIPDHRISNSETNKKIFVEDKRQDGWVEGKPKSAGRGNAHERGCKYFAPGIDAALRSATGIHDKKSLPFWAIFQGDISRDPRRVPEITMWFGPYMPHCFFWWDSPNSASLIAHFEEHIRPLLL